MGELNKFFVFAIFLVIIESSLEQIIIPINSMNEEPTIVTKESFTIRGIDGSPVRVTRINVQRNSRNLNGGGGDKHTPLELMRLMDDRINSIFEELISQRIGLRIIFNDFNGGNKESEENKKEENNDKKNDNEEKNKNETKDNIENIDDKEFELDEDKKEDNNDKIIEQDKEQNITGEVNKTGEMKDNKKNRNNKIDKNKRERKEKKIDEKTKMIGKLKVNADARKPKKKKKILSQKEIIFSRVCKYIFYSIILFTIYILVRKLLELLEIIDPESNLGLKDVKINNNQEENKKDDENKKKEDEIILNKKKENKLN